MHGVLTFAAGFGGAVLFQKEDLLGVSLSLRSAATRGLAFQCSAPSFSDRFVSVSAAVPGRTETDANP